MLSRIADFCYVVLVLAIGFPFMWLMDRLDEILDWLLVRHSVQMLTFWFYTVLVVAMGVILFGGKL